MKLLSPEAIKSETDKKLSDQKSRIKKAGDEEKSIISSLNEARAHAEKERKRIDDELELHKIHANETMSDMASAILSLEERKRKALEPIESVIKEATKRISAAENRENEAKNAENRAEEGMKRLENDKIEFEMEKKSEETSTRKILEGLSLAQVDIDRKNNDLELRGSELDVRHEKLDERERGIEKKAQEVRDYYDKREQAVQQELNKARRILELSQENKKQKNS